MLDVIVHKWLNLPYTLHVRMNQRPSRPRATVLFLHGIGNTGAAWDDVVETLPPDLHLITIDLLGFGKSERPSWARYSAKTQARSVMATFLKLRINTPVILVGHSLGSLVAVEIAKRYPSRVSSLILCSPPFYKVDESKRRLIPNSDKILKDMYRFAKSHPDQALKLSSLTVKYGLVNKSFKLTEDDLTTYMDALESTIINQTSLNDAAKVNKPMTIIRGRFDPIIVYRNLRRLAKINPNINLQTVNASHEIITKPFITAVTNSIIAVTHPELVNAPLSLRQKSVNRLRSVKNAPKALLKGKDIV